MKCNKCGKDLKDGSKFCTGCGFKLGESQPNPKSIPTEIKTNSSPKTPLQNGNHKKPGNKKTIVFLSVILIATCICVGGIFAYLNGMLDFILPPIPDQEILIEEKDSMEEEEIKKERNRDKEKTEETSVEKLKQTSAETTTGTTEAAETSMMPTMEARETKKIPETTAYQEPETTSAPISVNENLTQNEKIEYIREVYKRTYENQETYEILNGKYYKDDLLVLAKVSNGNTVLDEVMQNNGYTTYSLEYYYDDQSSENPYPIFIFAMIDGKEYRYYFRNSNYIRRVGPEGSVNDSPEENSFITALKDEGASYR